MARKYLLVAALVACAFATAQGDPDTSAGADALHKAKAAHAQTVRALDDALAAAKRAHALGVDAANRTLLAAYDDAIARAKQRGDEQTLAKLRAERDALAAIVPQSLSSLRGDAVYECVLGVYGRSMRQCQYPFINLRPPVEPNLWSKDVQQSLRGKIDFEGVEYIGAAKLVVPAAGWYTLHLHEPGTQFRLNGMLMSAGDVELRKGVYEVEIYSNTWGQPYINDAYAYITKRGDDAQMPFVNTGEAITNFLNQRINDRCVTEVTGYKPKPVDIDVRCEKGAVVRPEPGLDPLDR